MKMRKKGEKENKSNREGNMERRRAQTIHSKTDDSTSCRRVERSELNSVPPRVHVPAEACSKCLQIWYSLCQTAPQVSAASRRCRRRCRRRAKRKPC